MTRIVVVGAGLGGMSAAYELQAQLGSKAEIVLVSDKERFEFTPSNPWIAVKWRQPAETTLPIGECVAKKGIRFVCSALTALDPQVRRLHLANHDTLDYDYLLLCTGPELAFDELPGAGPEAGGSSSVCTVDHARQCLASVEALVAEPGPAIVGALPGASCFGPAYEYAFILDRYLRDKKMRKSIPLTFVTSEPYIGHLGLDGVGDSKGMLESELRQRDIHWICNARTRKLENGVMTVEELDEQGGVRQVHELPYRHAMMLPAFRGIEPLRAVDGLVNPRGFVLVDEWQRNPRYPEIFAAGVCIAIPPLGKTPVPIGVPKTGYMIESMVRAIVLNIAEALQGLPPRAHASWNAICLADMGDTGAAFVAMPQLPPRNLVWFKKGKWVHVAKVGFEKYFLHKMLVGDPEPFYERVILKALGIGKLDEPPAGE